MDPDIESHRAREPKSKRDDQHKADTPHSPSAETADVAAAAKLLILVAAIYCYFAGWIYADRLFSRFGLSLSAIDIPAYYFFVYTYFVFQHATWVCIGLVAAAGAGLFVLVSLIGRWRIIQGTVAAIMLLGGFVPVSSISRDSADEAVRRIREGDARHMSFVLKREAVKELPPPFMEANAGRHLRLLMETKDRYYAFLQPQSKENTFPFGFTFGVAKTDVVLATIDVQSMRKGDSQ